MVIYAHVTFPYVHDCYYLVAIPFVISEPGKLFRHIIKFTNWPSVVRFKKHKALDHCKDVPNNLVAFRNKWKGISGIYKITFLPFRLFSYYGSTNDFNVRFKYHLFNSPKQANFLGLFLKVFGWSCFSITVVETCSVGTLRERENWYLSTFCPLLNVLTSAFANPSQALSPSTLTRSKISATLTGRTDSETTRLKKVWR